MNDQQETKLSPLDLASLITHINKTRPRTAATIKILLSQVPALETLDIEITPDPDRDWSFKTSANGSPKIGYMWLPSIEGKAFEDRDNANLWIVASAFAHVLVQLSGHERKSMRRIEKETAHLVAEWGIFEPPHVHTASCGKAQCACSRKQTIAHRSEKGGTMRNRWNDLLNLSLIGQTFKLDNKAYQFVKFMVRAKSDPVVATRLSDGTTHRFDAVQVARAFGKKN